MKTATRTEGGYVNYDARGGDLITLDGHNYRVTCAYPDAVMLDDPNGYDGRTLVKYDSLLVQRAYYAARLVACRPPAGETKR